MKCEIIQDLLGGYIDNTCSEATRKVVEEHLQTCEECRLLYKDLTNVEYEIHPVINETKPFIKIKRNLMKILFIVIVIFLWLIIFFGSTITSTIVKERMNMYVKKNYPQYDLVMTSFAYRDPEAEGFGVNNAFYVAEFSNPNQDDLTFAVYTEGFFLNLTDNYEYQIENRYSTVWRLVEEYSADAAQLLNKTLSGIYSECSTGLTNDHLFDFSDLDLNQAYSPSVDLIIPIFLDVNLYVTDEQATSKEIVRTVVDILKDNGFNTPYLSITLILDNEQIQMPDIYNLEY